MTDNVLQTLQQFIQDVIAPDVRELKVRVSSVERQIDHLEKQMEYQFAAAQQRSEAQFSSLEKQNEAQYRSILAAIAESKAQTDLINVRELARISERLAVLEAQRQ
jgi:hypothetical protein